MRVCRTPSGARNVTLSASPVVCVSAVGAQLVYGSGVRVQGSEVEGKG